MASWLLVNRKDWIVYYTGTWFAEKSLDFFVLHVIGKAIVISAAVVSIWKYQLFMQMEFALSFPVNYWGLWNLMLMPSMWLVTCILGFLICFYDGVVEIFYMAGEVGDKT